MTAGSEVLCWVVRCVGRTGGPVVAELALVGAALEPVEAHVHGLKIFASDVERDDAECSCVVRLYGSVWVSGVACVPSLNGVSCRDGFAVVDEECAKLGFGRGGHGGFDPLRYCENGIVVWEFSRDAGHEEVDTSSATGFCLGEVGGITVASHQW